MIIFILLLALIVRLFNLNQSLWLDEAAQAIESVRPLREQLNIVGDFQPPLYHLLLHFWMSFSHSEVWLRLLSVIFGVATVYFSYVCLKKITNKKVAAIASLLLAIAPFHIWYSQEVRPYALSALLGILATNYLLAKNKIGYVITSTLFIYTIYLAPFIFIGHGFYVMLYRRKWLTTWLKAMGIVTLSFLPWLPSFFQQLSIGSSLRFTLPGWSEAVSTPLLKALPLVFVKFVVGRISFENNILYGGISISLFIIFILFVLFAYYKYPRQVVKLLVLFLIPLVAIYAVSFVLPVLAPQRLLFLMAFFYGLFALGIYSLKAKGIIGVTILATVSAFGIFTYSTNPEFQREQWRDAVTYIESSSAPNCAVLFVFPDAFAPWTWYTKGIVPYIAVAPTFTVKIEELEKYSSQLKTLNSIYYFHYLTDLTDANHMVINHLKKLGFNEGKTLNFPGVGFVTIYEKTIALR